MSKLTWKRDVPGRQVSTCGRYAVASDGYTPGYFMDERDIANGVKPTADLSMGRGGEWAAVTVHNDDNLDWFDTMKEAKAECQRHADCHAV